MAWASARQSATRPFTTASTKTAKVGHPLASMGSVTKPPSDSLGQFTILKAARRRRPERRHRMTRDRRWQQILLSPKIGEFPLGPRASRKRTSFGCQLTSALRECSPTVSAPKRRDEVAGGSKRIGAPCLQFSLSSFRRPKTVRLRDVLQTMPPGHLHRDRHR